MRHNDWNQVHDIIISMTRALFARDGFEPVYSGMLSHHETKWARTVSIIGFGGSKLRGSMILSVSEGTLRRTHPIVDDPDIVDWLAELANLLLGRVKRELLLQKIIIEVSTPITLSAIDLKFQKFAGLPMVLAFDVGDDVIYVAFEAVGQEAAELAETRDETEGLKLGEAIFFNDEAPPL